MMIWDGLNMFKAAEFNSNSEVVSEKRRGVIYKLWMPPITNEIDITTDESYLLNESK